MFRLLIGERGTLIAKHPEDLAAIMSPRSSRMVKINE
jgi:hypothetical protein